MIDSWEFQKKKNNLVNNFNVEKMAEEAALLEADFMKGKGLRQSHSHSKVSL